MLWGISRRAKVLSSGHGGHGPGDREEDREEDEDEDDGDEEEVVAEVARKANEGGKETSMQDQQCMLL